MKELENLLKKEARERAHLKAQKTLKSYSPDVYINIKETLKEDENETINLNVLIKMVIQKLTEDFFNEEYKKVQEEFYKKVNTYTGQH